MDNEKIDNLINWFNGEPRADEDQARRTLAALLRTTIPLDLGLRLRLADLFDPDMDMRDFGRYLTIKRTRGNRKKKLPLLKIAVHVWKAIHNDGEVLKNAVSDTAHVFGCNTSTVYEAWALFLPIFERGYLEKFPSLLKKK
jgi:hypothetical protein